jgi:hypothetical protein
MPKYVLEKGIKKPKIIKRSHADLNFSNPTYLETMG